MNQLKCVACIVEQKLAIAAQKAGDVSPFPISMSARPAVAILNGQTTCEEHIVVQQQSSLAAPNGSPLMIPGR